MTAKLARGGPAASSLGARSGMNRSGAATVVALSAAVVVLLMLTDPADGLVYLLAFPICIVSKDLGVLVGMAAGACAVLFVALSGALGPIGYLGCAVLFSGAVAAGARPGVRAPALRPATPPPVLTVRPEVTQAFEALSPRELQILEMIATGANNAQIAERFVISQNTVKSHVSNILRKLPATNRTEAAFRYVELYGPPASLNGPASAPLMAASATRATVSALPADDAVLLSLEDGRGLDLPLLAEISAHTVVGGSAIVYFDHCDRPIGWYLPDQGLGVDLRRWAAQPD